MSPGRLFKKDAYLGLRMPSDDKEKLRSLAFRLKRDPSDLAWVLISEGVETLTKQLDCSPRPEIARLAYAQ